MAGIESFDNIYLDLSKEGGKCRFAENGLGWKPAGGGDTFTLDGSNVGGAQWSKAARGYEVKILNRTSGVIQLDGFLQEDYERLAKLFRNWYSSNLEIKEHSMRGWNWGRTEFGKAELTFSVQNRPAFSVPYSEISNTNLAGRNEVAIEFSTGAPGGGPEDAEAANGKGGPGSGRGRGRRACAGKDQLVEMRFYIPGTTARKEIDGDEAGSDAGGEDKNAAAQFYDTVTERAEIGDTAGDAIATFLEVLHLTPRGRFDIDMYESSFRLRGKTYDYKIQYDAIKRLMVLPKPDEVHIMLCIGLDPPLRQGQTRYPFVVMQIKKDEEVTIDLNLTDEELADKYKNEIQPHYESPMHGVVIDLFRGLAGKKATAPAKTFETHRGQLGIKCSIRASEGFLYCMEKAFMFVPKPATMISYDQTASVTFSRVSGALSALSTFDITVQMKDGAGSSQFNNISREDLKGLEDFFKLKGIKLKNEIDEDAKRMAEILHDGKDASDGEAAQVDRGSADEDEESVDEDFADESESDVAEEYDSNAASSGSGSESGGGSGKSDAEVSDGEEPEEERPKKKKKSN